MEAQRIWLIVLIGIAIVAVLTKAGRSELKFIDWNKPLSERVIEFVLSAVLISALGLALIVASNL